MPADSESSINAPSVVRKVHRDYRASASSSSLSPLLNANDWEDAVGSEANIMGSKDLEQVGSESKVHQEESEDMPGSGHEFAGFKLAEAEGRVGFLGLFENPLV